VDGLIIGTAGHVDHGKTEIVRALTGRETDRLREEKERGISIVLGFAPLKLGEGMSAGIVDVPGHERFVKNMVSGAVGVDVALLVVAADEGVMPQTEEHLEVLRLLGVTRGVVAITKIDLVDSELADVTESEVRDLLAQSGFGDFPFVRTSAVTGEGVEDLKEALEKEAGLVGSRKEGDFFRMPIDRVFTRSGIGTIVTGTTWSGSVGKGDELVIEPTGKRTRIREVQSFEHTLGRAMPGMRAALALHGIRVDEIDIGCQAITPGKLGVSSIIDASVEMSWLKGSKLKNRQRVRFHHAAAEILARVVLLDRDALEPGETGFVQLRLESPTVAVWGDRFVIRSYSPMHVIAGGRILDPAASKKRRFKSDTVSILEDLNSDSEKTRALALARDAGSAGFPVSGLVRFGMTREAADDTCAELTGEGLAFAVGEMLFDAGVVEKKEKEVVAAIEKFISGNRLIWGMDREELKEKMGLQNGPLFEFMLERGKGTGTLFFREGRIRAGNGERKLSPDDERMLGEIEAAMRSAGYEFQTLSDLAAAGADPQRLVSYLRILQERGSVVRVLKDSYMHADHHGALLAGLRKMIAEGGSITVGDFKDTFGFSRKFAVPLLEYLDGEGYTRREGDMRVAGPRLAEVDPDE
jgi:selenocysteine-specific elongation factor